MNKNLYLMFLAALFCSNIFSADDGLQVENKRIAISTEKKESSISFPCLDPRRDNCLYRYGKGQITILVGTSTAGKTTLIESVKRLSPGLIDLSLDHFFFIERGNIIKKYHPEIYESLIACARHEDISRIVLYGDTAFSTACPNVFEKAQSAAEELSSFYKKNKTTPEENMECNAIYSRALEQIMNDSLDGKEIILDIVNVTTLHELFGGNFIANVRLVLTFCGLRPLSERLKKRNSNALQTGEHSNRRRKIPLWQYAEFYRGVESAQEPVLEILTREDARYAFKMHCSDEMHKEAYFLKKLGFAEGVDELKMTFRHFIPQIILDNTILKSDDSDGSKLDHLFKHHVH